LLLSGTVTATFGLGLLLAAVSMSKILRLERESDARYSEIEEARKELKDLSARLVQAQENERTAISRELHDEVGQTLSAMLVRLSNLSAAIPPSAAVELAEHAGARGYLLKDSPEADLINAILAVHSGKAFFSPVISKMLVEDYIRQLQNRGAEDSYELLTTRRLEVLQLLAEGNSNKDVATILDLSLHTVETHRSNILQKLNLHGTPELILYAIRKGVIS
jgi:DNA-binding NarL/FixJ family response regulator